MNKEVRKLMEKHNVPQSTITLYGLEIERIDEEYAQQQVKLLSIPDVSIMCCDLGREFHQCKVHRCSTYGCLNCGQYRKQY